MDLQLFTALEEKNGFEQVFRQLLKAMSEPGKILTLGTIPPTNSSVVYDTTWGIAQTLLDADCKVSLLPSLNIQTMVQSLQFYTDCHIETKTNNTNFVFLSIDELNDLERFNPGALATPHESCTLIVQTRAISDEESLTLSGPGIKDQRSLMIDGLNQQQVTGLQQNHQLYPCGVDTIFCSPTHITALPRSTSIVSNPELKEVV